MRISVLLSIITYFSSSSALPPSDSTVLLTLENKTHYVAKIRNVVTRQGKPRGHRQDNDEEDSYYDDEEDYPYTYEDSSEEDIFSGGLEYPSYDASGYQESQWSDNPAALNGQIRPIRVIG